MTASTVYQHTFIAPTSSGRMDVKHEMIFRDDTVLLVKSEPQMYSPTNGVTNLLTTSISNNTLASSSALSMSNGIIISNNGLVTATSGVGGFNNFGNGNGSTNSVVGVVPPQPNKRPRNDDFLSSPSPGAISVSAPPLTPSPGPPSQAYTVISNGYSSPMSSGSYDPYSPNGKIGKKFLLINNGLSNLCNYTWNFFRKTYSFYIKNSIETNKYSGFQLYNNVINNNLVIV